jgi:hypothetical protein
MAKAPKKTYHILVSRYALHEFAVDADSHEEACKILERELDRGTLRKAKGGNITLGPFWADPADDDGAWLVGCSNPEAGETQAPIFEWNGKRAIELPIPLKPRKDSAKR